MKKQRKKNKRKKDTKKRMKRKMEKRMKDISMNRSLQLKAKKKKNHQGCLQSL